MNMNLATNLSFIKGTELIVVSTTNFNSDFIAAAVEFAIKTRIQNAKSTGLARRTAYAFCNGDWTVPRATCNEIIREMPVERLAAMIDKNQRQALINAINSLPY